MARTTKFKCELIPPLKTRFYSINVKHLHMQSVNHGQEVDLGLKPFCEVAHFRRYGDYNHVKYNRIGSIVSTVLNSLTNPVVCMCMESMLL